MHPYFYRPLRKGDRGGMADARAGLSLQGLWTGGFFRRDRVLRGSASIPDQHRGVHKVPGALHPRFLLYGLDADGKLDVEDWRVLLDVYNQLLESVPSKYYDYRDEFYPGYFLSIGMTGDDVKRLQQFLYQICVRKKNIPGVRVDGTFDSLTESSVKAIQKMANLPENGVVGPATWYQIVEMSKS